MVSDAWISPFTSASCSGYLGKQVFSRPADSWLLSPSPRICTVSARSSLLGSARARLEVHYNNIEKLNLFTVNPFNTITNGPKTFGRINGWPYYWGPFLGKKCMAVFPSGQNKVAVITRWQYYRVEVAVRRRFFKTGTFRLHLYHLF